MKLILQMENSFYQNTTNYYTRMHTKDIDFDSPGVKKKVYAIRLTYKGSDNEYWSGTGAYVSIMINGDGEWHQLNNGIDLSDGGILEEGVDKTGQLVEGSSVPSVPVKVGRDRTTNTLEGSVNWDETAYWKTAHFKIPSSIGRSIYSVKVLIHTKLIYNTDIDSDWNSIPSDEESFTDDFEVNDITIIYRKKNVK